MCKYIIRVIVFLRANNTNILTIFITKYCYAEHEIFNNIDNVTCEYFVKRDFAVKIWCDIMLIRFCNNIYIYLETFSKYFNKSYLAVWTIGLNRNENVFPFSF